MSARLKRLATLSFLAISLGLLCAYALTLQPARKWIKSHLGDSVGRGGPIAEEIENTRIAEKKLYTPASDQPLIAAEDWPNYRGLHYDGISHEPAFAAGWPKGGPKLLWSASVGLGHSSPIAAAGKIYLFTLNKGKETLTAFDANTGHILWNSEAARGWTNSYAGTRATPAIDADRIYTLGGHGDLVARDLATGKQLWTTNILKPTGARPPEHGCCSTPLVAGDLVYVQGGLPVDERGATALALNKKTGEIVWQSQAKTAAGYASPILIDVNGTRQLIIFGGESLYGMEPATG